jgi:hypothetical protein
MVTPKKKSNGSTVKSQATSERDRKLLAVLLCIALSAIAVVPFFFMGRSDNGDLGFSLRMPNTHDMFLHYDQMKSFYNGLAAGEVYPRWEEDTNRGFGAATTIYYPPAIYYVTSAFYFIARDWLRALLDAHLLIMIASAAALFFYARETMSRRAALVAMTAYIFLPYHLADQYQRGALAELLGFIWMPLILLFGERLMGETQKNAKLNGKLTAAGLLAMSYGAFLWSHPPTAYQFTLGFGLYVATRALMTRRWKGMIWIGAGLAMGLALSAAYIMPAFLEQDLIHREYIAETWPYHNTYVFVHDLYNTNAHRGFFHGIDAMWIFGTVVIIGSVLLMKFKLRPSFRKPELWLRMKLWIVLGGFASFMMVKLSQPLGMLIPKIEIGVFTWRMLSITTLVSALLAGACAEVAIEAAKKRVRRERLVFGSLALVVVAGGLLFSATAVVGPMMFAPVFVPVAEHLNYATLPKTAPSDPEELPDDVPRAETEGDSGRITIERWDPELRIIQADLETEDRLLVRTFNFPGWTAMVDGHRVDIATDEEVGDMGIELQPGSHRVTLDFVDTPPRRAGEIITICAAGLMVLLFIGSLVAGRVGQRTE